MKVYLQPPQPSRGLDRIAHALRRYAPPGIEVCEFPRNVDLTVIYAIGRRDAITKQCRDILSRGKRYVIVQVCLRSTMAPDVRDWSEIWERATAVWSYYDLVAAGLEDGVLIDFPNFYHAPLGADAQVFSPNPQMEKMFTIATSGVSRLQESVRECYLAADAIGGEVFHVGDSAKWFDGNITFSNGVDDRMLATYYSACEFVSGLRRTEGFELPAVEGLLCGARPIVFDTPDYHWNYGPHAEYVHEGTRQEVIDQLVQLFRRGARPVTAEEREQAVERFNWETIIGGFWQRCMTT